MFRFWFEKKRSYIPVSSFKSNAQQKRTERIWSLPSDSVPFGSYLDLCGHVSLNSDQYTSFMEKQLKVETAVMIQVYPASQGETLVLIELYFWLLCALCSDRYV